MSFQYNLFKLALKLIGVKKMTSLSAEQLIEKSKKMQKKSPFKMPKNGNGFTYKDYVFRDRFHTVRIMHESGDKKKAVMYLYGGGMMMPSAKRYFEFAKDMAKLTGRDVWYVYYPLCSDFSMKYSVETVYEVYQFMVNKYSADNVSLYGFSSGGGVLSGMLLYNVTLNEPLPKPEKFIAIAPGGCPADEKEHEGMLELNSKDLEIDAGYMSEMRSVMTKGEDVPEYMISGSGGNYTGFPETWFFYGGDEILSVKAKMYERNLNEAGVKNHIVIRNNMCHCYCIARKFPEAYDDYDCIISLLKNS